MLQEAENWRSEKNVQKRVWLQKNGENAYSTGGSGNFIRKIVVRKLVYH